MDKPECFAVTVERTQRAVVYVIGLSKDDVLETFEKADSAADTIFCPNNIDIDAEDPTDQWRLADCSETTEPAKAAEIMPFTTLGLERLWESKDPDPLEEETQEDPLGDVIAGEADLKAFFVWSKS